MDQLHLFAPAPLSRPTPAPAPRPKLVGEYFTGKALRARGWTDVAMQRFLGRPDELAERRRGGWTIYESRYLAPRVATAEATLAFQDWLVERQARREAALRGRERTLAEVQAWSPSVPRMALAELHQVAVDHYNRRLMEQQDRRGEYGGRPAALDSDPRFLARISVNYLRHVETRYEEQLARLDRLGHRGEGVAQAVKHRALEAIRATYPELATECDQQIRGKNPGH